MFPCVTKTGGVFDKMWVIPLTLLTLSCETLTTAPSPGTGNTQTFHTKWLWDD